MMVLCGAYRISSRIAVCCVGMVNCGLQNLRVAKNIDNKHNDEIICNLVELKLDIARPRGEVQGVETKLTSILCNPTHYQEVNSSECVLEYFFRENCECIHIYSCPSQTLPRSETSPECLYVIWVILWLNLSEGRRPPKHWVLPFGRPVFEFSSDRKAISLTKAASIIDFDRYIYI